MYFDAESDILCLITCSACGCCIGIQEDGVGAGTSGEEGVAVWMPGMLWGGGRWIESVFCLHSRPF